VRGDIWVTRSQITSLPKDLQIGGSLYLNRSKITSLPKDLRVGGCITVYNTPLAEKYTEEEIKEMYPGVKGKIYGAKELK